MDLGKRIKKIRQLNNVSQKEVSDGIISASHYSNIENGRYVPGEETLALLASKLAVPESYFLDINKDCPSMNELLRIYESKIEVGDNNELDFFIQSNQENFKFIPSLRQELYFNLLRFLELIYTNDISQAIQLYIEKINDISLFDSMLNTEIQQKYFYVTGLYLYYNRDYYECISIFKKALQLNDDLLIQAKISYNIALALFYIYQYSEALEYAKKSYRLYLEVHNWEKTGDCYNLIAVLMREKNSLLESEEYIKKGFSIASVESYELMAKLYHNLSLIRMDQGNYTEALENINLAITLKEESEIADIFVSYRTKLKILLLSGDIIDLARTLTQAVKHKLTKSDEAYYLLIKAQMQYLLEEHTSYEIHISKSIKYFHKHQEWKNLKHAAGHYSMYLEEKKRYKKAFEQQKLYSLALEKIYEER